jgi:radical SAM superfamily enzyme YgiQ (UPF0313 family)
VKILIILPYIPRYRLGHEADFVPPLTGVHLAALTPPQHEVQVIHQQVEAPPDETDAALVAFSFFSGYAPEAYRLADRYRAQGVTVVAGGPHVTFCPEEALRHFDAILTGEAESAWETLLEDAANGRLKRLYRGEPRPLEGIPTPRYDLLRGRFFIPRVIQATRGCPFRCAFCSVPSLSPGLRVRPVDEVLADLRYDRFRHWWQRKVAWFWDDNLTANRAYIRELLAAMIPLRRWWLTQASMEIAGDASLLALMRESGCIGVFFGIESFGEESLRDARKTQNKAERYAGAIRELHRRGICVMAGFIAGFDGDTPESIRDMARRLHEAGVDVPFLSILTPFRGTEAYERLDAEGRLLAGRGWEFYNGYNVTFEPAQMDPGQLAAAHRALWREAFSLNYSTRRVLRSARYLRPGAFLMCLFMNAFYCLKRLRGNLPVDFRAQAPCMAGKEAAAARLPAATGRA